LKDAFKDHFPIGTAVNRSMVTGGAGFRRSAELNAQDVVVLKTHFDQVTAENDMKWQLIHPREGANGYDFAPADALVNFAQNNQMQVVGHTLVWHSQTPNWVFAGTNPPPPVAANAVTNARNQRSRSPRTRSWLWRIRSLRRYPSLARRNMLGGSAITSSTTVVRDRYKGRVKSFGTWSTKPSQTATEPERVSELRLRSESSDPTSSPRRFSSPTKPTRRPSFATTTTAWRIPAKRKRLITLVEDLQSKNVHPRHRLAGACERLDELRDQWIKRSRRSRRFGLADPHHRTRCEQRAGRSTRGGSRRRRQQRLHHARRPGEQC
jgi:hypothetical protein